VKELSESQPGQGSEWDDLYERHAPELWRFVMKLLGDRERAADLVHDAFIRAMRSRDQLRDPAAVRPWLFSIAGNLARNELRRRRLISFVPFVGTEPGYPDAYDAGAAQIHHALASIPAEQAIALVLFHQQGFSRAEIAQITGLGEEGVKSRLARGRTNFIAAYQRLERGLAG